MALNLSPETQAVLDGLASEDIGGLIRTYRRAAGYPQSELAFAARVTTAYVSRIEDGQRRPSSEVFLAFCMKLDITPEQLLGIGPDVVDVGRELTRVLQQVKALPLDDPSRVQMELQIMRHHRRTTDEMVKRALNASR